MTRSATQLLRRIMTSVTEAHPISRGLIRSANQASELMTSATRRNVFPIGLRIRRVTGKTGDVCIQSRRNREPDAAAVSSMTSRTRRSGVFRVIESSAEAAQWWKGFDLAALNIRVTDSADLAG